MTARSDGSEPETKGTAGGGAGGMQEKGAQGEGGRGSWKLCSLTALMNSPEPQVQEDGKITQI